MSNLTLTRRIGQAVRLTDSFGSETIVTVISITHSAAGSLRVDTADGECLIVSVKRTETVEIAGAKITLVEASRGHVRLVFDAPRDIHILRTELIERTQA